MLVGTQMIGKGLDFPNVTLVGLIDADLSMHVPDFRANERTFQLLVQVAGRAGRGDRSGEVVVQTFTPQADAIQFSRHADYDGFVEGEMKIASGIHYPPFRHLIHHLFRGPNPEKLKFFAEHWAKRVEAALATRWRSAARPRRPLRASRTNTASRSGTSPPRVTKVVAELVRLRADFAWPDGHHPGAGRRSGQPFLNSDKANLNHKDTKTQRHKGQAMIRIDLCASALWFKIRC